MSNAIYKKDLHDVALAVAQGSKDYTNKEVKKAKNELLTLISKNTVDTEDHINELTYQITAPSGAKLLQLQAIGGNSVKYAPSVASDDSVAKDKVIPEYTYEGYLNYIGGASKVSKNLIVLNDVPETTKNGITYKVEKGIVYLINGTATINTNVATATFTLPAGTYYFKSFGATGSNSTYFSYLQASIGSGTLIRYSYDNKSFTLNVETEVQYIWAVRGGVSVSNLQFKDMLVVGSTAPTEFSEGFEGIRSAKTTSVVVSGTDVAPITKAIPSEIQALEGYGWGIDDTCYNYIDFETKKFIQKVARIDLSTLSYVLSTSSGRYLYKTSINDIVGQINTSYDISALSSIYNAVSTNKPWVDKDMAYTETAIGSKSVTFINNDYTNVQTFKQAMSGVYLYYELATPIETDISQYIDDDFKKFALDNNYTNAELINEYNYDIPNKLEYYGTIKETLCPSVSVEGANLITTTDYTIGGDAYNATITFTKQLEVSKTYTLSFDSAISSNLVLTNATLVSASGYISRTSIVFTPTSNNVVITFAGGSTSNPLRDKLNNMSWFMLNYGSTALSYRPHKDILTRNLPTITSDGYGVNADAHNLRVFSDYEGNETKERHIIVGKVDLGTLNWNDTASNPTYNVWWIRISNMKVDGYNTPTLIAEYSIDNTHSQGNMANMSYYTQDGWLNIKNTSCNSATELKQALNGVYLYYELADASKPEPENMDDFDFFFDVEEGDVITFNNPYAQQVYATYSFIIKEAKSNE